MSTDSTIEQAIRLARPGNPIEPEASKVVGAAADAINARGGPQSPEEARVCYVAGRHAFYYPSRDPSPRVSAERAARKAAEMAEVERRQLLTDAALEVLALARAREERATTADESSRLHAETKDAEATHALERDSLERAIAVLNTT